MPCRAFPLCGAFSFCGRVFLYAVFVFGRCVAFLAALRWCFSFGVAFCLSVFLLLCSVTAQILLVMAFCGVGGVFIYHLIKTDLNGFILPYTYIPIFYHFFLFYFHFFPFYAFSVTGRLKRSASFFGF